MLSPLPSHVYNLLYLNYLLTVSIPILYILQYPCSSLICLPLRILSFTHNHSHNALTMLIGFTLNSLPLALGLSGNPTTFPYSIHSPTLWDTALLFSSFQYILSPLHSQMKQNQSLYSRYHIFKIIWIHDSAFLLATVGELSVLLPKTKSYTTGSQWFYPSGGTWQSLDMFDYHNLTIGEGVLQASNA